MQKVFPRKNHRRRTGPIPKLILASGLGVLSSCQSYLPKSLNLAEHREAWQEQSPSSRKVGDFAKTIADSGSGVRSNYNPSDGLSLGEAELVALVFNPDLRTVRLQAGLAQAVAGTAGRWDDPELGADVMRITDSVPKPWIIGSSLSLTIPVSGRLQAEKARAAAEADAALERVAEKEWQVRHELRAAWLEWSAARLRKEETGAFITSLDTIIGSTAKLRDIGELPKTEANLFTIERAGREAESEEAAADISELEQRLRALMGLAPSAPVDLVPALSLGKDKGSNGISETANPTLVRLRAEYAVAERTLQREVRKQYPDLTIGPQAGSEDGQSRIGFVSAIPLPILNSNKGGIAEAKGQREIARAAFETEYERLTGQLAAAQARESGLLARRDSINGTLVPLVDEQAVNARKLLELGEGSSLVLLESLVRAHDTKLRLVELQLDLAKNQNDIRHLLGPQS